MEHLVPSVKSAPVAPASLGYLRDVFGHDRSADLAMERAFGPYSGPDADLSDHDIRRAIDRIFRKGTITKDLVVEEVDCWRGQVRADYLCIRENDLAVIEIKSDRDTLARFDEQMRVYSAIARRVTVIVGWNLAARVLRRAPRWWEVLLAERMQNAEPRFVVLRDGARNPSVAATALLSMLPVADVRVLASRVGLPVTLASRQLRELVALRASDTDLRDAVRRWLTRISNQRLRLQA